jgi:hypothetical protein
VSSLLFALYKTKQNKTKQTSHPLSCSRPTPGLFTWDVASITHLYLALLHLAFHFCGFCIYEFNQLWIKFLIPDCSKKKKNPWIYLAPSTILHPCKDDVGRPSIASHQHTDPQSLQLLFEHCLPLISFVFYVFYVATMILYFYWSCTDWVFFFGSII